MHRLRCDVFAPCALGGPLSAQTIGELRTPIVCGAANNPLADDAAGDALATRGIVYAPDYVVNAGGMHNATGDIFGKYDVTDVRRSIAGIRSLVQRILVRAAAERVAPHRIAAALAMEILQAARLEQTRG